MGSRTPTLSPACRHSVWGAPSCKEHSPLRPPPRCVRHGRPNTGPHLLAAPNSQRHPIPRCGPRRSASVGGRGSAAQGAPPTFRVEPRAQSKLPSLRQQGQGGGGQAGAPGAGREARGAQRRQGPTASARTRAPPGPGPLPQLGGFRAPLPGKAGTEKQGRRALSPPHRRTQQLRKDPAGRSVCFPRCKGGSPAKAN